LLNVLKCMISWAKGRAKKGVLEILLPLGAWVKYCKWYSIVPRPLVSKLGRGTFFEGHEHDRICFPFWISHTHSHTKIHSQTQTETQKQIERHTTTRDTSANRQKLKQNKPLRETLHTKCQALRDLQSQT